MTETETAKQLHDAADLLRQFAAATESGSTALLHPRIMALFADWLGCLAVIDPAEWGAGKCEWCNGNHPEAIARTIALLVAPAEVTP